MSNYTEQSTQDITAITAKNVRIKAQKINEMQNKMLIEQDRTPLTGKFARMQKQSSDQNKPQNTTPRALST